VKGILKGQIEGVQFSQPVTLDGNEMRIVVFSSDRFTQLNFVNPRLWWPAHLGPQNLYRLKLQFNTGGLDSDQSEMSFGIREMTSELENPKNGLRVFSGHDQGYPAAHLIFRINGKRILIRGAAYTFDMMLRNSARREEAALRYARDMNLNVSWLSVKWRSGVLR
jgi:exo-1,4-beta-D-glucosaminidase